MRAYELIQSREFKRMWRDTEQNVDQADFRRTLPRVWLSFLVEQLAEENITNRLAPTTPREVASDLIVGRLPHALAAIQMTHPMIRSPSFRSE